MWTCSCASYVCAISRVPRQSVLYFCLSSHLFVFLPPFTLPRTHLLSASTLCLSDQVTSAKTHSHCHLLRTYPLLTHHLSLYLTHTFSLSSSHLIPCSMLPRPVFDLCLDISHTYCLYVFLCLHRFSLHLFPLSTSVKTLCMSFIFSPCHLSFSLTLCSLLTFLLLFMNVYV